MVRAYEILTPELTTWIQRQQVFFVATAPAVGGHVNCSPKGLHMLRVLDPRTIAYLDLTGSGIETIAHLQNNGRIVLMFCAFEGPPKILRVHGKGDAILCTDERYRAQLQHFMPLDPVLASSARAVIRVDVDRIADSCGHGVPLMRYEGERTQLIAWTDNRLRKLGPDALAGFRDEMNGASIDGLPGLRWPSDVGHGSGVTDNDRDS